MLLVFSLFNSVSLGAVIFSLFQFMLKVLLHYMEFFQVVIGDKKTTEMK